MKDTADLITAIATLGWAIMAAVALYILFPFLKLFLSRDKVRIKIGEMELSAEQATESISTQLKDLQNKVLEIEKRLPTSALAPERQVTSQASGAAESTRAAALAAHGILWVDDRPSNNAIQIDRLREEGWLVDLATTTAQGLEKFHSREYAVVVTDVGRTENGVYVPDAGLQLAKEIRQHNEQIPIIAFTTRTTVWRLQGSPEASAISYFTTSTVELYRLIDTVRRKENAN